MNETFLIHILDKATTQLAEFLKQITLKNPNRKICNTCYSQIHGVQEMLLETQCCLEDGTPLELHLRPFLK